MLMGGCNVSFEHKSASGITNSCQLLHAVDMEQEICAEGKPCIQHGMVCEDTSYSPQMSGHTSKDWRADYKGYFRKSQRRERVNAGFDSYKNWGIGENRFFVISDNIDAPTESSGTLYFYLNAYNMPRIVGATIFDAETRKVAEYEFEYDEIRGQDAGLSPAVWKRKLAAERTFTTPYTE